MKNNKNNHDRKSSGGSFQVVNSSDAESRSISPRFLNKDNIPSSENNNNNRSITDDVTPAEDTPLSRGLVQETSSKCPVLGPKQRINDPKNPKNEITSSDFYWFVDNVPFLLLSISSPFWAPYLYKKFISSSTSSSSSSFSASSLLPGPLVSQYEKILEVSKRSLSQLLQNQQWLNRAFESLSSFCASYPKTAVFVVPAGLKLVHYEIWNRFFTKPLGLHPSGCRGVDEHIWYLPMCIRHGYSIIKYIGDETGSPFLQGPLQFCKKNNVKSCGAKGGFIDLVGFQCVFTIDPVNVEWVLKKNFNNYPKGPQFQKNLHELLGDGIFAADGDEWHWQRKVSVLLFTNRNFEHFIFKNLVKHAEELKNALGENATKEPVIVNLYDYMQRFTLDSIGEIGFGENLGCISAVGSEHAFLSAFDFAQEGCEKHFYYTPWIVQRYLVPIDRLLKSIFFFLPKTVFPFSAWEGKLLESYKVLRGFGQELVDKRKKRMKESQINKTSSSTTGATPSRKSASTISPSRRGNKGKSIDQIFEEGRETPHDSGMSKVFTIETL